MVGGCGGMVCKVISVQVEGRLQSKYKFKVLFLYTDIPAKINFSEKFMF